jgi:hypothetical protein
VTDTQIDIEIVAGLALPYQSGAEAALADPDQAYDPGFDLAWQAALAGAPGLTLEPLYAALDVELITNITDAIRMAGEEPPDPLNWFYVTCDELMVDVVLPLMQALPFVEWAGIRPEFGLAGVVSWGTNPNTRFSAQIAPSRVDAIYAWQVPGGTGEQVLMADVEYGWNLDHEDFSGHDIEYLGVVKSTNQIDIDHGTAMAGLAVASDNGTGIVGIAPRAKLSAVAVRPGLVDAAIQLAAANVGRGGVVFIPLGQSFLPVPKGEKPHGDIPVEYHRPVQEAIRRAILFGSIVVEAAGNGYVNLDQPLLRHRWDVDSGAILVGAAMSMPNPTRWLRAHFPNWGTSYGGRVDCFGPATKVGAPSGGNAEYDDVSGTSSATAIVAGVIASIQGMALAATRDVLNSVDIRRLLRNRDLGRPTIPVGAGIGAMPDLRRICQNQRWAPIMPASVVANSATTMTIGYLDTNLRLFRRHWTPGTGWGVRIPHTTDADEKLEIIGGQQVALTAGPGVGPGAHPVTDAVVYNGGSEGGVHYVWWDTVGSSGSWSTVAAPVYSFAAGRSLAAVRSSPGILAIVGVNEQGQLTSMLGNLQTHVFDDFKPAVLIDAGTRYLRPSDPTAISRTAGHLDVVMISDIGLLVWYHGTTSAGFVTHWSAPVFEPTGTEFVPTARPAVVATLTGLEVVAVGAEGWLYSISINTATGAISAPVVIDVQVTVSGDGPVAIVSHQQRLVALAVELREDPDREWLLLPGGPLRAATRGPGGDWSSLRPVDPDVAVSGLGGVSATVMSGVGIAAVAVLSDGKPYYTMSTDGETWSPLRQVAFDVPIL